MDAQALGLAVAFTAGVLSFLSPCVLPLIPSYATFI
ncbi:MAG: cytochrome c biogenesis protein CcdA, partial [Gemmatimonadota bacterium]|nr:cytochrome c biogenesis protein CcdA [Gemmatimonadota bacterium]